MYEAKISEAKKLFSIMTKKINNAKGTNIYRCDNWKEKMDDKDELISHINKEQITCTV